MAEAVCDLIITLTLEAVCDLILTPTLIMTLIIKFRKKKRRNPNSNVDVISDSKP